MKRIRENGGMVFITAGLFFFQTIFNFLPTTTLLV